MRRVLVLSLLYSSFGFAAGPTLFRDPALSKTHIVFHHAGDLWIAAREGGAAQRLTSGPGQELRPYFSPDGQWIAFTGEYDGNVDVFVVAATGGVPRRLTWHPGADTAVGWTPDGKSVIFRSARESATRGNRLFVMPVDGVFPSVLPFPMGEEASYSPDSAQLAYVPLSRPFTVWKRYRGGGTTPIWLTRLSDSAVVDRIPRDNSNDFSPMWVDGRIFFLSDRNGLTSLFAYDTKTRKVTPAVPASGLEIKSAAAGPGAIVYEQFGTIYLYDLAAQKPRKVEITLAGDLPEVRPRLERLNNRIRASTISPTGVRALFEARGEILTVPAEKGDARNLTNTVGAVERDPSWSADGQWIAYFSDESGEYELHVRKHDGQGAVKKFPLNDRPNYYYSPTFSPDNKKIAYTDKKLHIAYIDLETGKTTVADADRFDGPRRIEEFSWAPDSKWLTYTKQLQSTLRAVFVYSLESGKSFQVTDGMSDATSPVFDRNGEHLYFLASTDVGLNTGWRDMSSLFRPVTNSVYVVVLRKDLPSPLAPESDEEKGDKPPEKPPEKPGEKKTVTVKIDPENIEQRILAMPIPSRSYAGLTTGKTGVLFVQEEPFTTNFQDATGRIIHKFDLKTRKTEKFVEGVGAFVVSDNGEKVLFRQGQGAAGRWVISGTAAVPKPGEGTVRTDGMEAWADPRTEWRQMYREAWRLQRDFFYEPGLHGLDVAAASKQYEPFLEGVGSRSDLNYLFAEMMGNITVSHLNVAGGQTPDVRRVTGGLLGADYKIENGRYRFARVYNGENWNPDLRAPLTQPGVNVVAGEYLLAVNGRDLPASDNIYSFFEATAGKQVLLKVGTDPGGAGARDVTVVPVATENRLRNLAWIESNRRKVDQLSGGKLAYVYLPDTATGGYTSFNRYYFAQVGKQGVVVDERFNGGGFQADYIIDYLRRPLLHYRTMRSGEDITGPLAAIFGPKAMIINEYAGSGGDVMPWYFRREGLGPLIGKTTWGGLVGGLGGYPPLMDGGFISVPACGFWDPTKGKWVAENVGIPPDIEVDNDPKLIREGKDPQLEKAVEVLLAELRKNPPPKHARPPFPKYAPGTIAPVGPVPYTGR